MTFKSILLAAAFAVGISTQASADLVTNGGFETGDFSGWTVATADYAYIGVDGNAPHSGNFGAYIGADTTISQSIATVAGQTYSISFWLMVEADVLNAATPNSFSASFGGVPLLSLQDAPASDYTVYTFNVTASQNLSLLSFFGSDTPAFLDLDDVKVSVTAAVPEPSTWAMMILGFLGLSLLAYRRQDSALRCV